MSSEFGGFGLTDVAPDATVTMTNEDTNFPKEWCVNGLSNEPTQASTTSCKIRFEFASAKNIKLVALIGTNMQNGDTINFNTYSASGWGTPSNTVDLELRWYERKVYKIGANTVSPYQRTNLFSTLNQNQKYYEVELSGSSNPLVGEVCLFEESFQFNRNFNWGYQRIFSPSKVTSRVNRTLVSKQANEAEDHSLKFDHVADADMDDIKDAFRAKGRNILFIPDYDQYQCFYGIVSGPNLPQRNEFTGWSFGMKFEESAS